MTDRHYEPEELEKLGRVTCGLLSEDYESLASGAYLAGAYRDAAFDGSFASTWDECFTIFYNCLYETAANIQSFGVALVEIVAQNLEDEKAIEQSIIDAQNGVYGSEYTRVEAYAGSDEIPEQAPGAATLDDNPYAGQLAGDDENQAEPI